MTTDVDDFLEHFGVKGMKWGVRRAEARATRANVKLAKKDAKWESNMWKSGNIVKAMNEVGHRMNNGELGRLNNQPKYKKLNAHDDNSPLTKQYFREYSDLLAKHSVDVLQEIHGASPSGKFKVGLAKTPNGLHAKIVPNDAEHAANDELVFKLTQDEEGRIISMTFVEEEVLQSEQVGSDFISHYGVKGMKWGKRKRTQKEEKIRAKRFQTSVKRRQLSDAEVEKYVKRLENEKKLKTLVAEDLTPGRAVAKKLMSEGGQTAVKAVITGAGMYAVRSILQKKFDPKEAAEYLKPKKK